MTIQYVNKATLNGTSTVYWVTSGAADTTGAQSGYNIANLTNIAVDYTTNIATTNIGGTVNPSAVGGRIPPDANDIAVWTLQEASGNFLNSGSGGADPLQDIGATPVIRQASGLVLPYAVGLGMVAPFTTTLSTTTGSGTDTIIEPAFPATVSCWVKIFSFNNTGSFQHIFEKLYRPITSGWSTPYTASALGMGLNSGSVGLKFHNITDVYALGLGEWHHIGATYDGTTAKMYVDGSLIATSAQTGAIDYGSHGPWIIGQNPANSSESAFSGLIQDIRVANIARPASYFQKVYQAGTGLSSNLIPVVAASTIISDGYTNLPTPGVAGRLFLPTDTNKPIIYRDNGASWKPFSSGTVVDTFANRPISGANGQLFIPSDGGYQQIWDGSSWRPVIGNVLCTEPPAASAFTQSNFSTSTLTKSNGGLIFNMVPATDPSYRAALISIPTPSSCQIQTLSSTLNNITSGATTAFPASGLIMVESSTGKAASIYTFLQTDSFGYRQGIGVVTWSGPNTRVVINDYHQIATYPAVFLRLRIASTNLYFECSNDLVNWNALYSTSVTSVFTSNPDQYGIAAFHFGAITSNTYSHFKHLYLG